MIAFRVDSSSQIGTGHLMRCLALAKQLKRTKNLKIIFICRNLPGNLTSLIKEQDYKLYLLPPSDSDLLEENEKWLTVKQSLDAEQTAEILQSEKIDLIIVDHYGIDISWESIIRSYVKRIMVIDDLADRQHDCDILLDQNYQMNKERRYRSLVPNNCKLFLGIDYLLLRTEFYENKKYIFQVNNKIKNILVFFGGSDDTAETFKILEAINFIPENKYKFKVLVSNSNPKRDKIKSLCSKRKDVDYYCQINNMAQMINESDIAFGAGGTSLWERCYLGLPSIVTIVAENQREIVEQISKLGAVYSLGWHENITMSNYLEAIKKVDLLDRKEMSRKSLLLFSENKIDELIDFIINEEN